MNRSATSVLSLEKSPEITSRWRFDFSLRSLSERLRRYSSPSFIQLVIISFIISCRHPTVVGKVMRPTGQPALFIPFLFFSLFQKEGLHTWCATSLVRNAAERERKEWFLSVVPGPNCGRCHDKYRCSTPRPISYVTGA